MKYRDPCNHRQRNRAIPAALPSSPPARGFAALLAICLMVWCPSAKSATKPGEVLPVVRMGISLGMWTGVNVNDANAAIQAWAQTILKQRGSVVKVENQMFRETEQLAGMLTAGTIDGASVQSEMFLALDPKLRPDHVFLAVKQASPFEQYVALVHHASGLTNVHGLRGRKIVLHQGPRTSLAALWLATVLAEPGVGVPAGATPGVVPIESASRAVLGVFFRQSDACVVTTNAFALACELNPQLRRDLRVLAISPAIVPSVFFFRPGYTTEVRDQLESAIVTLHQTPAGQQVMAVFQCDRMEKQPAASCLASTQQLLVEYERLKRGNSPGDPRVPLVQSANDGQR